MATPPAMRCRAPRLGGLSALLIVVAMFARLSEAAKIRVQRGGLHDRADSPSETNAAAGIRQLETQEDLPPVHLSGSAAELLQRRLEEESGLSSSRTRPSAEEALLGLQREL